MLKSSMQALSIGCAIIILIGAIWGYEEIKKIINERHKD